MKRNKIKRDQFGVTLMETIVALGVLILGIIMALSLMASSLAFSQTSEQSIVVTNLAREGIEIMRSIKSLNGFDALVVGDKRVTIDVDNNDNLVLWDAGNSNIVICDNCVLRLYNGRYIHHDTLGNPTIFKRLITISDEVVNQEKRVVSQVYWTERGREHIFQLESHLTNW